ncbi:MAG: DUF368 domain-containing protein [Bacilli bacterium]|nr:DUF368 domain-containing protein [Bacilli bacterium]
MNSIMTILKGFVLGIANIIPGVSGGTLAITLGIYEKLIEIISNFSKKIKDNIKFVILLVIGVAIGLLLFSNIISTCLDRFPFVTIMFFIGIILGGTPILFKKVNNNINISNIVIFFITFSIVMIMTFISSGDKIITLDSLNIIKIIGLFFAGFFAAASMLLPGISGSFILMLIGYYKPIVDSIKDLTHFNNILHNIIILGFVGIGILFGLVLSAKLINWLLKKYEIQTYFGIIGFVIASVISIFISTLSSTINIINIIIGIVMLIVGILIAKVIGDK